jgi:2-methylaconitate cis-trans-isomerase PrpF
MSATPIPAAYLRGGTSKGVFLHARDVPPPGPERDSLLLRIMGTPDPFQIDGMGGTVSSTSKVVIVEPGSANSVTYWFAQLGIDEAFVDWSGNCGNLTTAVGPFAIDEGLVTAVEPFTRLRLVNGNTGVTVEAEVGVADGRARTRGDLAIAGVPGTGAPILTRYLDPAGGVLGALFPTGGPIDVIDVDGDDVTVSIIDVAHPYVFVGPEAVGLVGDNRTPQQLNQDERLLARVERIRGAAAVRVGAAASIEAASTVSPIVPRIVVVQPDAEADIRATAFSLAKAHRALPMTAALCLGAAARLQQSVVGRFTGPGGPEVQIRHPRGIATVMVEMRQGADPIRSVGIIRTARRIMDGRVYPRDY